MGDINPPKEDEPWQGERRYDRTWEQPTHLVSIATPFAIGRSEISRAEYTAFVEASGYMPEALCWTREDEEWLESEGRSWQNPGFEQTESEPIVCVNRSDAYAYMDWLSALTGQVYRLPSEADWEYAARAGTRTHYSWGDALGEGNANCRDCGSPWDGKKPAPIASFSPNKWGLFDMPGNVWEPALDCFHIGYGGAPSDGSAWDTQGARSASSEAVPGMTWVRECAVPSADAAHLQTASATWGSALSANWPMKQHRLKPPALTSHDPCDELGDKVMSCRFKESAVILTLSLTCAGLAHAGQSTTSENFCNEIQLSIMENTVEAQTVVHPDWQAFLKSKASVDPLRNEQFITLGLTVGRDWCRAR